jgi:hypothetical protein
MAPLPPVIVQIDRTSLGTPRTRGQAKKADHAGTDGLYVIVSVGSRLNTEGERGGKVPVGIQNKKNNK